MKAVYYIKYYNRCEQLARTFILKSFTLYYSLSTTLRCSFTINLPRNLICGLTYFRFITKNRLFSVSYYTYNKSLLFLINCFCLSFFQVLVFFRNRGRGDGFNREYHIHFKLTKPILKQKENATKRKEINISSTISKFVLLFICANIKVNSNMYFHIFYQN